MNTSNGWISNPVLYIYNGKVKTVLVRTPVKKGNNAQKTNT